MHDERVEVIGEAAGGGGEPSPVEVVDERLEPPLRVGLRDRGNTTPERFAANRAVLAQALKDRSRDEDGFPNALATMWTWVSNDRAERDRVLTDVLAPLLRRDPDELRGQVCVGSVEHCAELLSRYAAAGCQRVYLWPLGEEQRQLELVAGEVAPLVGGP